jgi:hypothetical protein
MPKDLHLARQLRGEHSKTDSTTIGKQQGRVTKDSKKKPVDHVTTTIPGEAAHATAEAWKASTRGRTKRKKKPPTKNPAREKPAINKLATKKPAPPQYYPQNPAQKNPPQNKSAQRDPLAQEEEVHEDEEPASGEEQPVEGEVGKEEEAVSGDVQNDQRGDAAQHENAAQQGNADGQSCT